MITLSSSKSSITFVMPIVLETSSHLEVTKYHHLTTTRLVTMQRLQPTLTTNSELWLLVKVSMSPREWQKATICAILQSKEEWLFNNSSSNNNNNDSININITIKTMSEWVVIIDPLQYPLISTVT